MNTKVDKRKNYYNQKALAHIIFIVVLYLVCDVFFLNLEDKANYSTVFYLKLLLVVLYSMSSSVVTSFEMQNGTEYVAVNDFSTSLLAVWVAVTDLFIISGPPSYFSAIFLFIGIFSSFNLLVNAPLLVEKRRKGYQLRRLFFRFSQILIVAEVVAALMILVQGEWIWKFYNPFELLR
jgi:hypothetical protein